MAIDLNVSRSNNEWNDALTGLIEGAAIYGQRVKNAAFEEEAASIYQKSSKYINNVFDQLSLQNKVQQNNSDPNSVRQGIAPEVSQKDALTELLSAQNQLGNNPYGKPYADSLGQFYKGMMPEEPEYNDYTFDNKRYRLINGVPTLLQSPEADIPKNVPITQRPQAEIMALTEDQLKNLNINDVWDLMRNGMDVLPEEKRTVLKNLYPDVWRSIEKEFEEATRKGTSGRGYSGKGVTGIEYSAADSNAYNLLMNFAQLKSKDYNSLSKVNQSTGIMENQYDLAKKELQALFPGRDIDALADNVFQEKFKAGKNMKTTGIDYVAQQREVAPFLADLHKFQFDIEEKVYAYINHEGKKVPNFNISPADWAKELVQGNFLRDISDAEYDALAEWFQNKTGQPLEAYVK